MKTQEIQNSQSTTKFNEYVELATILHAEIQENADVISDELLVRIASESASAFAKCKNADCEYTAYVNCLEVEAWHNRSRERRENL